MDWQQKAAALNAIAEINICIRAPGDWYVSHRIEIKDNSVLIGACGNGATPEEAINDHWRQLVEEVGGKYLVVHAGDPERRRALRWNGYMWADVPERPRAVAVAVEVSA